jgi:hypothetical protein
MTGIYEKLLVTPIGIGPTLRQGNGFGSILSGYFAESLVPHAYYKQFTFTLMFVSVYLGEIYLLRQVGGQGVRYVGKISADDFRKRFGMDGYIQLRVSGFFESVGVGLLAFGALFLVSYVAIMLFGRN